jgi:hypothetical protein
MFAEWTLLFDCAERSPSYLWFLNRQREMNCGQVMKVFSFDLHSFHMRRSEVNSWTTIGITGISKYSLVKSYVSFQHTFLFWSVSKNWWWLLSWLWRRDDGCSSFPGSYLGYSRVVWRLPPLVVPLWQPPPNKSTIPYKNFFKNLHASKSLPHSWNRTELPFFTFN